MDARGGEGSYLTLIGLPMVTQKEKVRTVVLYIMCPQRSRLRLPSDLVLSNNHIGTRGASYILQNNVFGTEKHRQQSEKLLNFMIALDVTTCLVSGERVWYRARAAGLLLL